MSQISQKYRPDIDGLRALAIIPVILFHTDFGCSGGFVGVDVFFVISGFLITSLILTEINESQFSLLAFWERRIRRILPALVAVVLFTLIVGWFVYLPDDYSLVGKSVVAQAALLSNVFFYLQTGYFKPDAETKPLLHTWSLAVEEQFYAIFPLLLVLLAAYRHLFITRSIVLIALASFGLNVLGSYTHLWATFYLLPTRAWELMMGAFLAAIAGRRSFPHRMNQVLGMFGFMLIMFSVLFYTRNTRFPGVAAIPPCLGAALIILSGGENPALINRILALKPIVFVGLISYSLYLWHWPLIVFTKYSSNEPLGWQLKTILIVASFVMASLSWKFIEVPFRKRLVFPHRQHVFAFAGGSLLLLAVLGAEVYTKQGMPHRLPEKVLAYYNTQNEYATQSDLTFRREIDLQQAAAGRFAELGNGNTNQPIELLLWGDSHAMSVAPVLDELCRRHSIRGVQATHSRIAPLLDYVSADSELPSELQLNFSRAVAKFITHNHIKVVVIAMYWNYRYYTPHDRVNDRLDKTVQIIMDSGAKVYVLKEFPIPGFNVPRIAALTFLHNSDLTNLAYSPTSEAYQSFNQFVPDFNSISKLGAIILDPHTYLINSNGCYDVIRNDQLLYFDSNHLTVYGSKLLRPMFEPLFSWLE